MEPATALDQLEAQLPGALLGDAAWARAALERARARLAAGKPADRSLARIAARLGDSCAAATLRGEQRLRLDYPEELPVSGHRERVIELLRAHPAIVLTGETGSGKTTQLPKMLLEAGYGRRGLIALTQPRRVAAVSVAARIREECEAPEGAVVHSVRFDDHATELSLVRVMTDGLLLAEAARDRDLSRYEVIVIDEAHERSLNVDVLLGLCRRLIERRPELRVVVTSATIDAERFAAYLGTPEAPAPMVQVSGRTFPVEQRYRPPGDEDLGYLAALIEAVRELHAEEAPGDVLCFLPTERDILEARRRLQGERGLGVLPLFGRLTPSEQQAVFKPARGRKVVLATNIAETSITVPGIRYVVDAGLARIKRYHAQARTERLPVEPVAQASLRQRAGRAGRTQDGVCIRLMERADAEGRSEFTDPEIKRSNLAGVLLQHLAMGLGEPEDFPWLDPPSHGAWTQARTLLLELGALEGTDGAARHRLSPVGRRMARIPSDPQVARILLAGIDEGCAHEACTVAAFLSVQDPRVRPVGEEGPADSAHAAFHHEAGDLATLLNLWDAWGGAGGGNARARLCKASYLGYRRMREWADVRHQLWQALREDRAAGQLPAEPHAADARPLDALHRAVLSGLLGNVCMNDPKERCYRGAGNRELQVHPGSSLRRGRDGAKRKRLPPWLVACELVETSRLFARLCAPIDPAWVVQLAGDRVKRSYRDPRFDPRVGRVVCSEKVTWKGLPVQDNKAVAYAAVDPVHATELFIRQALVHEQLRDAPGFFKHNRRVLQQVRRLIDRLRDRSLILDDERLFEIYHRELGRGAKDAPIASLHDLRRWTKANPVERLSFHPTDFVDPHLWDRAERGFPETVRIGGADCRLFYRFAPGEDDDGVTLRLEQYQLPSLRGLVADRLVPGLVDEQVEHLVRLLPKDARRSLIPVADAVAELIPIVAEGRDAIPRDLARAVAERIGRPVPSPDPAGLPPHLRLRFVVRDEADDVVYQGRDLEAALAGVGGVDPLAPLRARWATEPDEVWPGELPKQVSLAPLTAHLALLRDRGRHAGVAVRRAVFASRQAAEAWHEDGLEALLEARLDERLSLIAAQGAVCEGARPDPALAKQVEDLLHVPVATARRGLALSAALGAGFGPCRDAERFAQFEAQARERLDGLATTIDRLLADWCRRLTALRKRLKKGVSGLGAAAVASGVAADARRRFQPSWPRRLPWAGAQRIGDYLDAAGRRLDLAERNPDAARRVEERHRRLIEGWDAALHDLSPRLLLALGLQGLVRDGALSLEELLWAGTQGQGTAPQHGASEVKLRDAERRIEAAVADHDAADRAVSAELLDLRPFLERAAEDGLGRALLTELDAAVRDLGDCSHGADLWAQRDQARALLARCRRYLG